jgi:hypothetical protein
LGPVFIHVDAKTDISKWRHTDLFKFFIPQRIPVYWGDWSIVEATTLLLENALQTPSNTRFSLLSGSHYPILSNADIEERAQGVGNLVASRSAPNMPDGSRPESDYLRRFFKSKRPHSSWTRLRNGVINRVLYFGRPLDWKSVAPSTGMRAGEQFWSIERHFAEYCVAQIRAQTALVKYFKQIVCSDEKVFATLYGEYANDFVLEGTTYSKWVGGPNPQPLSRRDLELAIDRDTFWFARKFTSRDSELLDWLDQL